MEPNDNDCGDDVATAVEDGIRLLVLAVVVGKHHYCNEAPSYPALVLRLLRHSLWFSSLFLSVSFGCCVMERVLRSSFSVTYNSLHELRMNDRS